MRLLNSDIFYIGLGCFIISFLICKLMVLVNLSDNPNHRSIHIKTNPTGGGLGIIAALGFSLILKSFTLNGVTWDAHQGRAVLLG